MDIVTLSNGLASEGEVANASHPFNTPCTRRTRPHVPHVVLKLAIVSPSNLAKRARKMGI